MELDFSLGTQNPSSVPEEHQFQFGPGFHAVVPVR
jgi:hypothetical protein